MANPFADRSKNLAVQPVRAQGRTVPMLYAVTPLSPRGRVVDLRRHRTSIVEGELVPSINIRRTAASKPTLGLVARFAA